MKLLHISRISSIYTQGYDSSDLEENPLLSLPKILGSFDAQNLHRFTVQIRGMIGDSETFFFKCLKLAITKIKFCHILQGFGIWTWWWKCLEPFFEVKMWLTPVSQFLICFARQLELTGKKAPTFNIYQRITGQDQACSWISTLLVGCRLSPNQTAWYSRK